MRDHSILKSKKNVDIYENSSTGITKLRLMKKFDLLRFELLTFHCMNIDFVIFKLGRKV